MISGGWNGNLSLSSTSKLKIWVLYSTFNADLSISSCKKKWRVSLL